jgi:hypothetical protein
VIVEVLFHLANQTDVEASGAALSMLGAASSLYFAAHNIRANIGQSEKS